MTSYPLRQDGLNGTTWGSSGGQQHDAFEAQKSEVSRHSELHQGNSQSGRVIFDSSVVEFADDGERAERRPFVAHSVGTQESVSAHPRSTRSAHSSPGLPSNIAFEESSDAPTESP
eukprot:GDKH01006411.1.p1 GENE.GDKH01006411.1~~GDKH01006411.1.p1  ORF type:complete len:116 (-),score=9.11 GDKH01006411.1:3-350(-)